MFSFSSGVGYYRENWNRRWCVLLGTTIFYFREGKSSVPSGAVDLVDAVVGRGDMEVARENCMSIKTKKRTYYFCDDEIADDRNIEEWMAHCRRTIEESKRLQFSRIADTRSYSTIREQDSTASSSSASSGSDQ